MSPRRKIPTKAELQQLQKLYKTDEKIGERLGGVPAYLVAYWRRKKNIPKYSLPKFSEREIRNLWERYGDDEKCGLELGISKAAFYNWRRRYGIKEKPAFLKLEQLELNFPNSRMAATGNNLYGKRSMAEKLVARLAEKERVEAGEEVTVEPDILVIAHEVDKVIEKFKDIGSDFVFNPNKIILSLDRLSGDDQVNVKQDYQHIRDFVKRQGIKGIYDVRDGNIHQAILEKGQVLPGNLVVGIDDRALSFGCVGALTSYTNLESMGQLWADGKLTLTMPASVKIQVTGRRARGVFITDIMQYILKQLKAENVKDKALEYSGSTVSQMSINERFTLTAGTRRLGAAMTIGPYDATVRRFLTGRTDITFKPILPDKDAEYEQIYQFNIDHLTPQITAPDNGGDIKAVSEVEGLPVFQIVLGSYTSGRFEDLRVAADVLKGKKIHPDCRLFIIPASRTVYLEALKKGLIRVFIESGAMVLNPGSEQGLYLANGGLIARERVLTTVPLDFAPEKLLDETEVYLCSPGTAAVSALNAAITEPSRYVR